jgi:hypothetical protein
MIYCPICNAKRFTKCTKSNCINKSYEECEHLLEERIPVKCIYYIPLIPKLVELIKSKNFKHYYDYTFNTPLINDNIYSDLIHGNKSQQIALPKMNQKGNNFYGKYVTEFLSRDDMIKDRVEVITLLLSYFYDSALLFKRSNESLSILNVTILNFPYQIRNIIGVGTIMVALHKSLSNDLAQKVLFRQLFSDELNILEKGFFIEGDDNMVNELGRRTHYYLQARVVIHNLDTIALKKQLNFEQCHNSYSGCYFCRKCRGKYFNIFKNHIYGGHRGLSPFNHILRKYGQSKSCCSNNFYLDTYDKHYVKEYNGLIKRVNIDMPITDEERRKNKPKLLLAINNYGIDNKHYCCKKQENIDYLINSYDANDMSSWAHQQDFPFDILLKDGDIYYEDNDFRDVICGDTIPNSQHIGEVSHVMRNNLTCYNGVKEPTALQFVKSIKLNDYNYEPFRVIGNNCENFLKITKGRIIFL